MTTPSPTPTPAALPRRRFIGRLLAAAAGTLLPWRGRSEAAVAEAEEPYIGDIMIIPFGFAPKNWAFCNGQLVSIVQNTALFSILGTTYGGNGQTTFALPDLRGRLALHFGQGPGLADYSLGQIGGETDHTLTLAELPTHTHVARAASAAGLFTAPSPMFVPARNPAQIPEWGSLSDVPMGSGAITTTGLGQPHPNIQPFLTLHFVICLFGLFPPHRPSE